MERRKYALHPGYITSKNDGDRHFISARQLARLYGVKIEECVVWGPEYRPGEWRREDYVHFYPRYDGDYKTPNREPTEREVRDVRKAASQLQKRQYGSWADVCEVKSRNRGRAPRRSDDPVSDGDAE